MKSEPLLAQLKKKTRLAKKLKTEIKEGKPVKRRDLLSVFGFGKKSGDFNDISEEE